MHIKSLLITTVIAIFGSTVAQATTWQMATPYPESNFHTKNINKFTQEIAEKTDGKLNIKVHSAGSLIKHKAIKKAVRTRQVEIGEFFVSIESNENPIYALDSVPFVATSFDDAHKLYEASIDELTKVLNDQGLKVLYSVAWPPQGLYTSKPVKDIKDLSGMKFRVYNSQLARFAKIVHAVPVQIEVPDLPQAFTTGRVDAMLTSASTGVDTKAWDYLKYFYDVKAYLPRNIVVVNQKVFDRLDDDTQKIVLDAAQTAQKRGWKMAEEDHDVAVKELKDNGIKVSHGSDELNEELHKIGKKMADEWAKSAGETGKKILDAYNKSE